MKDFIILTDATADISQQTAEEWGVDVLPMTFTLAEKEYHAYPDEREIPLTNFYKSLRTGAVARTSAINDTTFVELVSPYFEAGKDVLYIGCSSGISTTYDCSVRAAEELNAAYPNNEFIPIDSLSASLGLGLLVYLAVKFKQQGNSLSATKDYVLSIRDKVHHVFTVEDLMFLKRGGRLGAASAAMGTVLNIKPILTVSAEGKLVPYSKVQGRKKSLKAMMQHFLEFSTEGDGCDVFISHCDSQEDAHALGELIQKSRATQPIYFNQISPIVGSHSGPGTIALFFISAGRLK